MTTSTAALRFHGLALACTAGAVALGLLGAAAATPAQGSTDAGGKFPRAHHSMTVTVTGEGDTSHATVAKDKGVLSLTAKGAPPASAQAKRLSTPLRSGEVGPRPTSVGSQTPSVFENSKSNSTLQLLWHNGYTQRAPRVYLVFWGANWFTGGDPNGVANRLHYFYQGLGGSSYNNVLKQYTAGGTFTNPTGQYKGWLQDTTAVPASPTKAQMAAAAQRAALRTGDVGYDTQYVIALPNGIIDQDSVTGRACGWHGWTGTASTNAFTYTSLPYSPYLWAKYKTCGAYTVNGTNGLLDGVTIVAAHEYVETVNDPYLNAWYDGSSPGSENADKCAWLNLKNYTLTNGYAFPVQPYWSNAWRTTYGNGCLYS